MINQNIKLADEDKELLKEIAKKAIESQLKGKKLEFDEKEIPETLKQKRASFVTLKFDGNLRGCIGHILPVHELYVSVVNNARCAAFADNRFLPLVEDEFGKIKIEISILSKPKKLDLENPAGIVKYLHEHKPGVIIRSGLQQSTFLPQVWEDLPEPEEFLSRLCLKAHLPPEAWRHGAELETYTVEKI